jgi:hypothetical protein
MAVSLLNDKDNFAFFTGHLQPAAHVQLNTTEKLCLLASFGILNRFKSQRLLYKLFTVQAS